MRPVAMNARHGQRESPQYKAQDWSETVGLCAQRRVALMPRAIAIARDALSNADDRHESAAPFRKAC